MRFLKLLAILVFTAPQSFAATSATQGHCGLAGTTWGTSYSFTPDATAFGTVSATSYVTRRVGDSLEGSVIFTMGTVTANVAKLVLPTGLTIDSSKISSSVAGTPVGEFYSMHTTTTVVFGGDSGILFYDGSDTSTLYFADQSGTVSGRFNKSNASTFAGGSNIPIQMKFKIPISGWGVTDCGGANHPNARYHASSTSLSGSLATIVWTTSDWDSNSAMSSGVYTCPAIGKYQVNAGLALSGTFALNNATSMELQVNSTAVSTRTRYAAAAITNEEIDIADIVNCAATTDTIRIQVSSAATGPGIVSSNVKNWISIQKID